MLKGKVEKQALGGWGGPKVLGKLVSFHYQQLRPTLSQEDINHLVQNGILTLKRRNSLAVSHKSKHPHIM